MPDYAPYRHRKPSQIDWLGDVPAHWQVIRIKHLTSVKRGASPRPIDDPKYFDDEGEFAWVRIADVSASKRYLEATTQRLSETGESLSVKRWPGDIFLSIAGTVGKPIITKIKCCIHDGFVYFPEYKNNNEFLYYIFACGQPYLGLGKMGTQLNLNTDTVGSILIGLPPIEEQAEIVRFLDFKTAQIDILIAKQLDLLNRLTEKRTALISEAVTKGLNASVATKDSGVAWLGQIPSHWRLLPLKYAVTFQRGHDLPADARTEGAIPLVSSSGISSSHDVSAAKGPGIVTGRYGTIGKFTYIESDYWPLNTTLYSIETYGNNTKYLWFMMHLLSNLFVMESKKGAVPGVDRNDLHPVMTAIPPRAEQDEIVARLEKTTLALDLQAEKIAEVIDRLQEYRSALITSAVTGKIDVRGFRVPPSIAGQAS